MPLPITNAQRRLLAAYQRFRNQGGPGIGQLLGWPSLCYLTGGALFALAALFIEPPWWAVFALGWAVGALYTNAVNARRVIRSWPTIAEVVDWDRVGRLVGQNQGEPFPGG